MHDLGVKLYPVNLPIFVRKRRDGTGPRLRIRQNLKSVRSFGDIVGMAHPADALFGDRLKEVSRFQNADFPFAVLTGFGVRNSAAQRVCNELTAIADSEHGYSERKYLRRDMRRRFFIDAVGAAREDDAYGIIFLDFLYRHIAVFQIAIYIEVTHAARDELIILSAEIEDEDFFVLSHDFSSLICNNLFVCKS